MQIGAGQRDNARFNVERIGTAQPLKGALLQDAKQFALRLRRKCRDLIQNDGPFAAQFQPAQFALHRTGERPAFVAEKFAFDKLRWERCAVNLEEGCVAPRAELMDQPCEVVFAGTGFSRDQKSGRSGRDFLGEPEQAPRRRIGCNERKALGHTEIVAGRSCATVAATDAPSERVTVQSKRVWDPPRGSPAETRRISPPSFSS